MHQCRPLSPVFFSGSRAKLESFCHHRRLAVTLCLTQTGIGQRPFDVQRIDHAPLFVQNYFNLFLAAFIMPSEKDSAAGMKLFLRITQKRN